MQVLPTCLSWGLRLQDSAEGAEGVLELAIGAVGGSPRGAISGTLVCCGDPVGAGVGLPISLVSACSLLCLDPSS